MAEAHEHPRFTHAATYAVVVTYTVAGGARPTTAHRRAGRVAERLANAAARAADVIDASAVVGPVATDGEIIAPAKVHFAGANTGRATYGQPDKLSRYLDPDHERARASLAEANARHRAHREADRDRRRAVGCRNTERLWSTGRWVCGCVYCEPTFHLAVATQSDGARVEPPRCLCGQPVDQPDGRCRDHPDVELTVLDDDPQPLHDLARALLPAAEADAEEAER